MGENLAVGLGTMVVCLTVQCVAIALLLRRLMALDERGRTMATLKTGGSDA